MLNRRKLIIGLVSFVAAPAIVRVESLMKIKIIDFDIIEGYDEILFQSIYIRPEWSRIISEWSRISYDKTGKVIAIKNIDPKDIYIDYT